MGNEFTVGNTGNNEELADKIQQGSETLKESIDRARDIDLKVTGAAEVTERIVKEALEQAKELGRTARKVADNSGKAAQDAIRQAEK